jgi:hypothetical protein
LLQGLQKCHVAWEREYFTDFSPLFTSLGGIIGYRGLRDADRKRPVAIQGKEVMRLTNVFPKRAAPGIAPTRARAHARK